VLVTHEVAEAIRLADRVSLLSEGRISHCFAVRARPGGPPPGEAMARDIEARVAGALFSAGPPDYAANAA
jgi:ABC-type nitrate/sulfonate/bicarbonate transport system ATPase subunit